MSDDLDYCNTYRPNNGHIATLQKCLDKIQNNPDLKLEDVKSYLIDKLKPMLKDLELDFKKYEKECISEKLGDLSTYNVGETIYEDLYDDNNFRYYIIFIDENGKKNIRILSYEDISKYEDGIILTHETFRYKSYSIVSENKDGEKSLKYLFCEDDDFPKIPQNIGLNAITDVPIGHFKIFDYGIYMPIDIEALGITSDYINDNIKSYHLDEDTIIYYLIVNYSDKNYCFYLEHHDKVVLTEYLLDVQYLNYIEYNVKYESFYKYLSDKYNIDDVRTHCMSLCTF